MNDVGFLLKQTITFFIEPLGLVMTLFFIGLVLLFLDKNKLSKLFLSISLSLLFLFSFSPVSNFLVKNLENVYPKYDYKSDIKYIHVLGGGHNTDISQPVSSHLLSASTKRVLEGVIIHKNIINSKIIFTGYAGKTDISTAVMNSQLALALGVDKKDMIINGSPKDTQEEAIFTKSIVGSEPFVLVTSASHMPRAMIFFKSLGMNPIPAPTDFHKYNTLYLKPKISFFQNSKIAIHEYIGIVWANIKK